MKVSRRVIVQDMVLIRAKGYEIIAKPQCYMLYAKNNMAEYIESKNHINDEEIYNEFNQLSLLSNNVHIHKIEATSKDVIKDIVKS